MDGEGILTEMTITPESLTKNCGTEHCEQTALFCWAAMPTQRAQYPLLALMFAIPNGGERNLKVAANLKAEGVKAGVSDIMFPVSRACFHGLFIEMKVRPNKPTAEQLDFIAAVTAQKYLAVVCYSWQEAVTTLVHYLNLR